MPERYASEKISCYSHHRSKYTVSGRIGAKMVGLSLKRTKYGTVPNRGVPRGDAQDARASPLPPLCIPPRPCASPPQSLKGWL
jgi:hypothetical protein